MGVQLNALHANIPLTYLFFILIFWKLCDIITRMLCNFYSGSQMFTNNDNLPFTSAVCFFGFAFRTVCPRYEAWIFVAARSYNMVKSSQKYLNTWFLPQIIPACLWQVLSRWSSEYTYTMAKKNTIDQMH